MSELVITVRVQIPEGASVTVAGGDQAREAAQHDAFQLEAKRQLLARAPQAAQDAPLPPWPEEAPPDLRPQAAAAFDVLPNPPAAVLHDSVPGEWKCPDHGTPAKTVPGGVSKRTGKSYNSFLVCSTQGCERRPGR